MEGTCRMLRDLRMSPDDKVTSAFIPSGVTSMLDIKKQKQKNNASINSYIPNDLQVSQS